MRARRSRRHGRRRRRAPPRARSTHGSSSPAATPVASAWRPSRSWAHGATAPSPGWSRTWKRPRRPPSAVPAARTHSRTSRCGRPSVLHWDRDRAEQQPPLPGEVELPRRCPGPTAVLAGRLARALSRRAETSGFARRFFRMVVLQSQWDACFADAQHWASDAILSFPGTPSSSSRAGAFTRKWPPSASRARHRPPSRSPRPSPPRPPALGG